jgi:alkylation response protein AidB-like acyl-CoA dehydrogenase
MSIVNTAPLTDAAAVLTRVRELAPSIDARAEEIAGLRRLPVDLVADLKASGVFGMSMPKARGGPAMTPRQQCEVYEVLGEADAAVAWCVKIGSDSGYYAALLEDGAAATLFPRLDCVTAGQVPPNGKAERVDGGYRVAGHWTFGSGCTHADVIIGGCLVTEGGRPLMTERGPVTRIIAAPASSFEILDTWRSTGLAGSGSHDYRTADLFVPEAHTFVLEDPPRDSGPLYCYAGMFLASWHGVALGLTRHAIDAALAVVSSKMSIFPPPPVPLRQRPHTRVALAHAEMQYRAARAFTYETIDRIWDEAQTSRHVSADTRRAMMESLSFSFRTARQVAQEMYDLAGTTAVFSSKSPLDRLLRDAITMSQHLLLGDGFFEMIGAVMLGEPPPHLGIL